MSLIHFARTSSDFKNRNKTAMRRYHVYLYYELPKTVLRLSAYYICLPLKVIKPILVALKIEFCLSRC